MMIHRVGVPCAPALFTDPPAGGADPGPGPVWPRLDPLAEVYAALVTGVRDYVRKNRFRSVILGLSGGIDSALTATIAADAIGADLVHVVLMPSQHSSGHSVTDAEDLVKRQGLHARTVPIQPMVDAFRGRASRLSGLAAENLQARVRGVDPHGAVQRRGPPGADDRQQERARHRLLHPVRRLGGRVRADQGRAEDAGMGPGAVAQRGGCPARADPAHPGELDHQAAERRAAPPASSTPTRCPTTRCWTPCSRTTWSRTWVRPSSSPPGTTPPWWTG